MNSNLIINERPLIIIPSLAKAIGLNESIILQQLHYWLQRSKNIRMDRKWVYFTYENLAEQFPFFSVSTIRRVIGKLEEKGLLQSGHFNKMKMDHTKWYAINYEALDELSSLKKEAMINDEKQCSNKKEEMIKQNSSSVQIEQTVCSDWTDEGVNVNSAIPKSTPEITPKNTSETSTKNHERNEQLNPYRFYEENGFGVIGSFISEKISAWCLDLSDELVVEAMKIAVNNSSKKWSYVEAILRDWVDKGYQTAADVQAARLAGKQRNHKVRQNEPIRKEMIPDWFLDRNVHTSIVDKEEATNHEEEKRKFLERRKKYLENEKN